jgi:hypothetical protein
MFKVIWMSLDGRMESDEKRLRRKGERGWKKRLKRMKQTEGSRLISPKMAGLSLTSRVGL